MKIITDFHRQYIIYLSIYLISSFLLFSCVTDTNEYSKRGGASNLVIPYNITILIDLSDRNLSNNYPQLTTDIPVKHDTTAIRIILSVLKETFRSLTIKDKLNIEPVHQDNSNYDQYYSDNYEKLKIDMEKIFQELKSQGKPCLSIPVRKKEFDKRCNTLIKSTSELENIALQNQNPSGGDVTKFLKEKLKYYFRQDYKNVLVILTDGDEAFNSDIQKSRTKIDLNGNYTGLKIFMCGINAPNSSKNQNEISEIRKNWITKFQQIGINEDDIEFNEVNDINLIETKVKQFVNVN